MATGGGAVPNKRQSLTCGLCLNIYMSPKLLPVCHHTFCEQCLKDLAARYPTNTFPCPACREETEVPPGGVSAFKTNFYIDPQDLERARDNVHCMTHLNKELEFYCLQCDEPICLNCKLTEHELHETTDLARNAGMASIRFKRCMAEAKKSIELVEKEQQAVKDKKTAVQAVVRNRHATLQAAIDKYRDDALTSLDTATDDMLSVLQVDLFNRSTKPEETDHA
ncbi:hypothetical protein BaRGS_00024875 [Batillaria attramentaria]|uniref:Uncharacterized protein n=1 Tax=Batillaria attramentaria TaxID=370345 RepID=A0ABD0K9U9_9CAEN